MQVLLRVGERSLALDMALYSNYQLSIHNIELCHGFYTISIVYQSIFWLFMCYAKDMVRPDDPGTDIGLLCFRTCSSVLLVHPKGGRPGDARVVTSFAGVVLGYAGSFGYDRAPRCDWGRREVVTAVFVRHNSGVAINALPDIRI